MTEIPINETARILSEALPFLQRYDDQIIVVKYGGHAMVDPRLAHQFARDMVMLKVCGLNPIVVHGGGPQINKMLDKLEVKAEFRDGLRVTDAETMAVVEMVLAGAINKSIVASIQQAGGRAVGISGKDGNLMIAERLTKKKTDPETGKVIEIDFGFVGEPARVNTEILETIMKSDAIPVIVFRLAGGDHGVGDLICFARNFWPGPVVLMPILGKVPRYQSLHCLRCEVVANRRPADRLGASLEIRAVPLVRVRNAVDSRDGVGVDGLRLLHRECRPACFDRAHAASLISPRATVVRCRISTEQIRATSLSRYSTAARSLPAG